MPAAARHGLIALLLLGCGAPPRTTADYTGAGPYGVGERTLTFVDISRATPANGTYAGAPSRTLTVEVWYPADGPPDPTRDAAVAAGGPFPLVVHSHGFMDNRLGEAYLAAHLATRGYVVAAPDFPLSRGGAPGGATVADVPEQPGDVAFVIDRLLAEPSLAGAVDGARVGASGLSLGGLTTLLVAQHPTLRVPKVRAALPIAAPACMFTAPFWQGATVPLLLLHGDADLIVPPVENSERAFALDGGPRELVLLARGSHTAFTGLATLFDPSKNYDRLGCTALAGLHVDSFGALGTPAEGVSADPSVCPMPCAGTPMDPSLAADRQQSLTRAVAAAFFDDSLRADPAAHQFLRDALARENPEVTAKLP